MEYNFLDGTPIFETAEDALEESRKLGCKGYHKHEHQGKEVYMPCKDHDEILEIVDSKGQNIEDVLEENKIIGVRIVEDPEEVSKRYMNKLAKMNTSGEKFYRIISNPNEPSILDLPYRRFRYIYAPGENEPDLIDTSRSFCRRMMGGVQRVYRYEDIMDLSAQLEVEDVNRKIIPRPKDSGPVSVWVWKGGAGCKHRFIELMLEPTGKIFNNAQEAQQQAVLEAPAAGQTGQINLPPNYAGTPQQGFKKEDFEYDVSSLEPYASTSGDTIEIEQIFIDKKPYEKKDDYLERCMSALVGEFPDEKQRYAVCVSDFESFSNMKTIVFDLDGTLMVDGKPNMKTIEYLDDKKDDYHIVIISGRPIRKLDETIQELEEYGIDYDEIHLQDLAEETSGDVAERFKTNKVKKMIDAGFNIAEAISADSGTLAALEQLGIGTYYPSELDVLFKPTAFAKGRALFENQEEAFEYSMFCGCGGYVEEYLFKGKKMFMSCGTGRKEQAFSMEEEKRIIYTPVMLPGKIIPRLDEMGGRYFVTFTPEIIEKMAYKYMKEKRTDKVNYEHSDQKFQDVYMVESWVVKSENDKAYDFFEKDDIPVGTWMAAFKVDNDEVWNNYVKANKVKGVSLQGNFLYTN